MQWEGPTFETPIYVVGRHVQEIHGCSKWSFSTQLIAHTQRQNRTDHQSTGNMQTIFGGVRTTLLRKSPRATAFDGEYCNRSDLQGVWAIAGMRGSTRS
jgi:hypothetical protein